MFDATFAVIENEKQRNELADFYLKSKDRLYFIALSKLHNKEDAEDAVQDAFSQIADKPEKFFQLPPNKRLAYVDVMVRNISMKMFNAKSKEAADPLDDDCEIETVSLDDYLFDKISYDEIMLCVNRLPTMQRSVLIMSCLLGLSIDETAQQLNISVTDANKHLTLARKTVRTFIDERNSLQ